MKICNSTSISIILLSLAQAISYALATSSSGPLLLASDSSLVYGKTTHMSNSLETNTTTATPTAIKILNEAALELEESSLFETVVVLHVEGTSILSGVEILSLWFQEAYDIFSSALGGGGPSFRRRVVEVMISDVADLESGVSSEVKLDILAECDNCLDGAEFLFSRNQDDGSQQHNAHIPNMEDFTLFFNKFVEEVQNQQSGTSDFKTFPTVTAVMEAQMFDSESALEMELVEEELNNLWDRKSEVASLGINFEKPSSSITIASAS